MAKNERRLHIEFVTLSNAEWQPNRQIRLSVTSEINQIEWFVSVCDFGLAFDAIAAIYAVIVVVVASNSHLHNNVLIFKHGYA